MRDATPTGRNVQNRFPDDKLRKSFNFSAQLNREMNGSKDRLKNKKKNTHNVIKVLQTSVFCFFFKNLINGYTLPNVTHTVTKMLCFTF